MADTPPTVSVAASDCRGPAERSPALPWEGAAPVDFERIVAEHHERVARLAYRLLGWRDEVDDVVQEVFLAVFRNLDRFRAESGLRTWLTTITVNQCRSHLRKRVLRLRLFSGTRHEAAARPAASPETHGLERESFAAVRRALRRLPARYREVVVLRYLEDMPVERIAEVLGLSRNAVEVRLHRGRARLKTALARLL